LWAYATQLYDKGYMTRHQFGAVGRVLTNNNDCFHATENETTKKGYVTGYVHKADTWTKLAGFGLLHNILHHTNDDGGKNKWGEDISLHSTYNDAVSGNNPRKCRLSNGLGNGNPIFNYGTPFDGDKKLCLSLGLISNNSNKI